MAHDDAFPNSQKQPLFTPKQPFQPWNNAPQKTRKGSWMESVKSKEDALTLREIVDLGNDNPPVQLNRVDLTKPSCAPVSTFTSRGEA